VGQEYFINSQELQDKVASLLPSQGGAGSSVDLSASTQIVPIIDLTEQAEGSNVRADLQTALSHDTITEFSLSNTTTDLIVNTGYYRVYGAYSANNDAGTVGLGSFRLSDGTTNKRIVEFYNVNEPNENTVIINFDFIVFLKAGDSMNCIAQSNVIMSGCTRQIADISGNLTNP